MGDQLSPLMAHSSNILGENWGYKVELPEREKGEQAVNHSKKKSELGLVQCLWHTCENL